MTGSASGRESAIRLDPSLRTRVDRARLRCNGRDFIVDCTVIQVYWQVSSYGSPLRSRLCFGRTWSIANAVHNCILYDMFLKFACNWYFMKLL